MILKRKISELIKQNDRLYIMARFIKSRNDPNLVKLLKGYYEGTFASPSYDYVSFIAEHNGIKFPDEMIYHIELFPTVNEKKVVRQVWGFCGALRWVLSALNFADFLGMVPVVEWGNTANYYDTGMDYITKNVFEYYFDPVSYVDYREIKNCKNVIKAHVRHGSFLVEHACDYAIKQEGIEKLGYIYKKYIHLNRNSSKYVGNNVNNILNDSTVLGVHARGTDFNIGLQSHPIAVNIKEYLTAAKELYSCGRFDKVFLATDDVNILDLFKREFKDKLLYYEDACRSDNNMGVHATFNNRPFHYYKLGLEVLRDVYTLANCDSLICGLSQVSFAARYVNIALDREFKDMVILDNGLNKKDSAEAEKYWREKKKQNRKHKP